MGVMRIRGSVLIVPARVTEGRRRRARATRPGSPSPPGARHVKQSIDFVGGVEEPDPDAKLVTVGLEAEPNALVFDGSAHHVVVSMVPEGHDR